MFQDPLLELLELLHVVQERVELLVEQQDLVQERMEQDLERLELLARSSRASR